MTRPLHHQIAPHVVFAVQSPGRAARMALSTEGFGLEVTLRRNRLSMDVRREIVGAWDRVFDLTHVPNAQHATWRLSFETGPGGEQSIVLDRDGEVAATAPYNFALRPQMRTETDNIRLLGAQWDAFAIDGLVSAPDRGQDIILIDAAQHAAVELFDALKEKLPAGSEIRIVGDGPGDAAPRPGILRSSLAQGQRGIWPWSADQYSSVVLVSAGPLDRPDSDEVRGVIIDCPQNGLRLFVGGFVQKVLLRDFLGMAGTNSQLLASNGWSGSISFSRGSWAPGVQGDLAQSFERIVAKHLGHMIANAGVNCVERAPGSAFWQAGKFWNLTDWQPPMDGRHGFAWVFETLFGSEGANAVARLRAISRDCEKQGIRLLGCVLSGSAKPTRLLIDTNILALAVDATYALDLFPLGEHLRRIDRHFAVEHVVESDDERTVVLHLPGHLNDDVLSAICIGLKVASTTEDLGKAPSLAAHADACEDILAAVATINAIHNDHVFELPAERFLRIARNYPDLMAVLFQLIMTNAAPSKYLTLMDFLRQAGLAPQGEARRKLIATLIETRMFPMSDRRMWAGARDLDYDLRILAGFQLVERLPADSLAQTLPEWTEQLALLKSDVAYLEVLALLRQGRLAEALARGRQGVANREIIEGRQCDVLALAVFAEDFAAVDEIVAALDAPLSPLDEIYLNGCLAARQDQFDAATRQACTAAILHLDPELADLAVHGRRYRQLADFADPPVPDADVICVITAKNEENRLRETMAYHRSIGIRHFILIDNMSTDGTLDVAAEFGAKIIQTDESYKDSRYGMAWVNDVLDRHCQGFWVLVLDADEMFVYPGSEAQSVAELARRLEDQGYNALNAVLLDMYPEVPLNRVGIVPKGKLREMYDHFDANNLAVWPRLRSPQLGISGGVRDRVFRNGRFAGLKPIAHTKTPLVLWSRGIKYLTSTHDITPVRSPPCHAVLEHYKYTPDFVVRAKREVIRKEHWGNGSEYSAYASVLEADPDMSFVSPVFSCRRTDSTHLVRLATPFAWPECLL